MSEFLESAKRIAAANDAEQQRRKDEAAALRAQAQVDRKISHQHAEKFVKIMREHNIGKILLAQERGYYHVPVLQGLWATAKDWGNPHMTVRTASQHRDMLQEAQGRKLSIVATGWIAAKEDSYYTPEDYQVKIPGVFVNEKAETFLFSRQEVSRGREYVTPFDNEEVKRRGWPPLPDERALASDGIVERIGQMLVQYGIRQ